MAKKILKQLKLQIPGGKANPAPPVGPALGQAGINIGDFVKKFNDATKDRMGEVTPVVISVYDDRSYDFILKTPPATSLILKAIGVEKGAGKHVQKKAGVITKAQVRAIAEKKIKIKGGKRVEEEEKIYPGYVLVDMIVTDDSWYVVRNTPRVTGFVGSGVHPVPLDAKEVESLFSRMSKADVKHTIDMVKNDIVKITDGPFKDMEGKVNEVDDSRGKVKVLVSMFGRETPVELDFLQIKKI